MKSVLLLALRYLRFNKIKTAILVFSVAVAVFLPLAVNLLVRDYQRDLLARAKATPLVAGAPGSRLDLVLHALYFRGKPRPRPGDERSGCDQRQRSGAGTADPQQVRGRRACPIVGTSLEYFDFRGLHVADGAGIDPARRLRARRDGGRDARAAARRDADERSGKCSRSRRVVSHQHARHGHPRGQRHGRRRSGVRRYQDRLADHGHHARPSGCGHGRSELAARTATPTTSRPARPCSPTRKSRPRTSARSTCTATRRRFPSARSWSCRTTRSRRRSSAAATRTRRRRCNCWCRGRSSPKRSTWSFA